MSEHPLFFAALSATNEASALSSNMHEASETGAWPKTRDPSDPLELSEPNLPTRWCWRLVSSHDQMASRICLRDDRPTCSMRWRRWWRQWSKHPIDAYERAQSFRESRA